MCSAVLYAHIFSVFHFMILFYFITIPATSVSSCCVVISSISNYSFVTMPVRTRSMTRRELQPGSVPSDVRPTCPDTATLPLKNMSSSPTAIHLDFVVDDDDVGAMAEDYVDPAQHSSPLLHTNSFDKPREDNPNKKLKIGYIAQNLKRHPVGFLSRWTIEKDTTILKISHAPPLFSFCSSLRWPLWIRILDGRTQGLSTIPGERLVCHFECQHITYRYIYKEKNSYLRKKSYFAEFE